MSGRCGCPGLRAVSDYFRRVAGAVRGARIEPIVAKATDSVGVTWHYKALTSGTAGGGQWLWARSALSVAAIRRASATVR